MFSKRFRQLAEERGEKQVDIAHFLNVTEATISRYFKGRIPHDYQMLKKIARHYRVSVDYMIGNTDVRDQFAVAESAVLYTADSGDMIVRIPVDLQEIGLLLQERGHLLNTKDKHLLRVILQENGNISGRRSRRSSSSSNTESEIESETESESEEPSEEA